VRSSTFSQQALAKQALAIAAPRLCIFGSSIILKPGSGKLDYAKNQILHIIWPG